MIPRTEVEAAAVQAHFGYTGRVGLLETLSQNKQNTYTTNTIEPKAQTKPFQFNNACCRHWEQRENTPTLERAEKTSAGLLSQHGPLWQHSREVLELYGPRGDTVDITQAAEAVRKRELVGRTP